MSHLPLSTNNLSLTGKHAIVTGSTSGIGHGIATALAQAGASITLNGFGAAKDIETITQELQKLGVDVAYSAADMSKPADIANMITQAEQQFGHIDILVNNAGIQYTAPIQDFPDEKWEQILSINLSAAFYSSKHVLAGMQKRGFGRIINIASAHGLVASPHKAAYVAAKHGIVGLTKVTGLENAGKGITCNAICPGWVLTPLVQAQIDKRASENGISLAQAQKDLLGEKQPSMEFTTVEELGALAVFLCSPAARNMTGASYVMDGGWTAQ